MRSDSKIRSQLFANFRPKHLGRVPEHALTSPKGWGTLWRGVVILSSAPYRRLRAKSRAFRRLRAKSQAMPLPAGPPTTEVWDMGIGFKPVQLVLAPGTASGYKRTRE